MDTSLESDPSIGMSGELPAGMGGERGGERGGEKRGGGTRSALSTPSLSSPAEEISAEDTCTHEEYDESESTHKESLPGPGKVSRKSLDMAYSEDVGAASVGVV